MRSRALLLRSGVLILGVLIWVVITAAHWVDPLFLPSPLSVVKQVPKLFAESDVRTALIDVVEHIAEAFVIASICGLVAGLAMGLVPILRRAYLGPIVYVMSSPKAVILPAFVVFWGVGTKTTVLFGAFEAFFYVAVNVVSGVDLVEERHLSLARAFRANWFHCFRHIIFPAAMPGIFVALWYGLIHSFIGVMIAELYASANGFGSLIHLYSDTFQTSRLIAIVLIVSLCMIILGTLWQAIESHLSVWRTATRTSGRAAPIESAAPPSVIV